MDGSTSGLDVDRLLNIVEKRTGIHYRADQIDSVVKTAQRVMKRLGLHIPNQFLQAIEQDPNAYHELVDEITIGETYFFREPKHFDFVIDTIVPSFRATRGDSAPLQAWSAACASGEEAYSLAIACEKISQPIDIVATDLSPLALRKARRGRYRDWSFRGEAKTRVANYVKQVDDEYLLKDNIRSSVRFELMNLAAETYPNIERGFANFDLIFCRNVLIYFGRETIAAIAKRLCQSLRPGGWLITASGDPSLMQVSNFVTHSTPYGTFYRRADDDHLPVTATGADVERRALLPSHLPVGTSGQDFTAIASATPTTPNQSPGDPIEPPGPIAPLANAPSANAPAATTPTPRTTNRGEGPNTNAASQNQPTDRSHCLASAQKALESRQFQLAVRLTDDMMHHTEACVTNVRAREAMRLDSALETCFAATIRHPLSHELHYLHARLLADAGRLEEAFQAVQRSLFLDRSSVIAHFLFGFIQRERGELESARRHFQNTRELCAQLPPDQIVPMSDAEYAGHIDRASEAELATLPHQKSSERPQQ